MKRHPALIELSRDHHAALFVAMQLKRADETSAEKARSTFLASWDTHGSDHFRLEEEVLLPRFAEYGPAHHPFVAHVLCDHVTLRRLARDIASTSPDVSLLAELGTELEQHVRFEERQLFPLIESSMPEEALTEVADDLARDE